MNTDVIKLPGLTVTEVKQNEAGDYGIYVAAVKPPLLCPNPECMRMSFYRYRTKLQKFMDLPIHGQPVVVVFHRQRYQCRECGHTFWEKSDSLDDKRAMTKRLVDYIRKQVVDKRRTFTDVARDVGILEKTARDIFNDYRLELEDRFMPKCPRYLGIDEVHVRGRPRAVLVDLESRSLVDMVPDRTKPVLGPYMQRLRDRERVEAMTMDMWEPYRDAAKTFFPKAQVIVDKFHVIKTANEAIEAIRKSIRSEMPERERRKLMRQRHLLLRRPFDLNFGEQMLLDDWCQQVPQIGAAYRAKEGFYGIYDAPDSGTALNLFREWRDSLTPDMAKAFEKSIRAFEHWRYEVLAYFDWRLTNATTEGLNSIARHIEDQARGITFEVLRVKMLFSDGLPKAVPQKVRKGTFQDIMLFGPTEYLGADISTLVERMEKGLL